MRRAQSFCCGAFFFGGEKERGIICRNIESLSSFLIFYLWPSFLCFVWVDEFTIGLNSSLRKHYARSEMIS